MYFENSELFEYFEECSKIVAFAIESRTWLHVQKCAQLLKSFEEVTRDFTSS